ncbi:MAG TPA: TlpA disulfide reductase family protein [Pyrinomonadaceae bacterium]|jgi:thiol-disulfide isomerase/thioredoxin|nr:TlpA disulfide reductase family protein [Pyrinomonadaceae bacterium]
MLKRIVFVVWLVTLPIIVAGQRGNAPALTLKDLRGRTVRLSDYRGKVVLLNFWATWCPPCRAEMPALIKWQQQYRGKGLQVIGITYPPTERSEVRRFIRSIKVNYPILLGATKTKTLFDSGETLPITVVIDREGNIRERIEGILLDEEFEQKVRPLLH